MYSLLFPNSTNPFFQHQHSLDESVALLENEQEFLLELLVPGFDKTDFKISASDHRLTVCAEKEAEVPEGFTILQKGLRSDKIEKTFRFRQSITADAIEAQVKDGVLRLKLPKTSAKTLVEIKAS
tara:strand:- start:58 stop:432 length:375 start_codon:yes stop_codon:yes gene_type:complete